jgi:HD-GYP domain-containing protein (c-di-GMP phosphodiesterase class II)
LTASSDPLLQSETVLQPLGRSLVTAFYAAIRALRLYPLENATVQKSLDEVLRIALRILDREEGIELRLVGNFLFVNDVRLRLDLSDYVSFAHFNAQLQRHGIGDINIERGIERQHLAAFLSLLLQEPPAAEDAFDRIEARLQASASRFIRIGAARVDTDSGIQEDSKEVAKRTYFQSVQVAREVLTDARMGRATNLRRVKRAIQSIVDQVLNDETSMMGMTALRDHDEYTFTHCVNVCIFSVVFGQKLGLTRVQLYELGLGALFHDIGKQRIATELVNKSSALTADEWKVMQEHPTEGLLMLFSMRGLSDVPYRPMLMAYEHHMKRDLSGYPVNIRPRQPALFSRIVAVVDGFDAATSKRSYNSEPWPADEVLREMRDNPQRGFDPLVVKAFTNVTGVFPVGTLAILDSYELAVVVARNPNPACIHQPIVKIVSDARGTMLAAPPTVDLSEIDPATDRPRRTIVKTTQAEKYGIRVSDYFI